jgi:hypothetical protein
MIPAFHTLSQARLPEIAPEFLSSWLGVLILFGGFVLMALTIWEKVKKKSPGAVIITPDPLQIEKVKALATVDSVNEMSARIEGEIEEMKNTSSVERAKSHLDINKLHDRINLVAASIDKVTGQLNEIAENQRLLMARFLK